MPGPRALLLPARPRAAELTLQEHREDDGQPQLELAQFLITKVRTGGTADLEIRIDNVLVGDAISATDGTIPASPGYDSGRSVLTWTGALAGHTVKVKNNGSVAVDFDGVYLGDQREKVRVWNAGKTGTKCVLPDRDEPGAAAVGEEPELVAVFTAWGINDYGDTEPVFAANITQWWTDVRTVLPDVSCGGLAPYATATRADWGVFVTMMKDRYASASVPIVDVSWPIQTDAQTADPRDLVFSDHIHQNAAFGSCTRRRSAGSSSAPASTGPPWWRRPRPG